MRAHSVKVNDLMRWLLLDRIVDCTPGVTARGLKTFPRSDLLFLDHFPGFPLVPGVLQIEMIAQLAGKCIALANPGVLPVLGTVKSAKFYRNVGPGDPCLIQVRIERSTRDYAVASGEITVNGGKVAAAQVLFGMTARKKLTSEDFDEVSREWLRGANAVAPEQPREERLA